MMATALLRVAAGLAKMTACSSAILMVTDYIKLLREHVLVSKT